MGRVVRAARGSRPRSASAPVGANGSWVWVARGPSTTSTSRAWAGGAPQSAMQAMRPTANRPVCGHITLLNLAGARKLRIASCAPLLCGVRRRMGPTNRRLLAVLLALASVAAFAGCGGEESEPDVEGLLDRAFRQSVKSADVKVDAQVDVKGLRGLERPVRLEASGVYIAAERHAAQGRPRPQIRIPGGRAGGGVRLSVHRRSRVPEVRWRVLRAALRGRCPRQSRAGRAARRRRQGCACRSRRGSAQLGGRGHGTGRGRGGRGRNRARVRQARRAQRLRRPQQAGRAFRATRSAVSRRAPRWR